MSLFNKNAYTTPIYNLEGDTFSKLVLKGPLLINGEAGKVGQVLTSQGGNPPKWATAEKPYKVYIALLSQAGTDAPTSIILENTIGEIEWTYENTGSYYGIFLDAFTENKTFVQGGVLTSSIGDETFYSIKRFDKDSVLLQVKTNALVNTDGYELIPIEIRVYPA